MNNNRNAAGLKLLVAVASVAILLAGCEGNTGSQGPAGPPGPSPTDITDTATSLNMTITGVTISSPPVVNFSVTAENGKGFVGLTGSDLRFTIAKLIPSTTGGDPSVWQNYINRVRNGFVQGNRETPAANSLVDHGDGTYTYTFATDITDSSQTCPAPCTDADGNALDTSYAPSLTHRLAIQTRGSLPLSVAIYDFRPSDGATTGLTERLIVDTAKCNECHNQLEAHDQRIDTRYCVTCHNPGSTANGQEGTVVGGVTIDFKSLIHKIHRGKELPSVVAGGDFGIIGYSGNLTSFKEIGFPQDIRNCTKCHDGSDTNTPQGDNWEMQPSIQACSSCHDDVYFGLTPTKAYQTTAHPGGVVTDNSECLTCHAKNRIAGSIAESHSFPAKVRAEAAKYKLNIVSVASTLPTQAPIITFSITDPTNSNTAYDIAATPAITGGSMSLLIGWSTTDFNNSGTSSSPNPISISLLSSGALSGSVTNNGDGTYSVTSPTAIPAGATGSGRVGYYARMSVDVDGDSTADRVPVTSVVKDFAITDTNPVARRVVVDIVKCDKCHDQLTLHGSARTDEPQLCVMCHNPNNTDVTRRPRADLTAAPSPGPCKGAAGAGANAIDCDPATGSLDGKKEESIDFKRMIHGIHGSEARAKSMVIYGYYSGSGPVNPFDAEEEVKFPGILNDCQTCHAADTYTLTGTWETPTQNGVLGSTIDSAPLSTDSFTDPSDDLNISPTAAVCSACHDSTVAQSHMTLNGALFSSTQATIDTNVESCAVCHGSGRDFDVATVHATE